MQCSTNILADVQIHSYLYPQKWTYWIDFDSNFAWLNGLTLMSKSVLIKIVLVIFLIDQIILPINGEQHYEKHTYKPRFPF